MEQLSNDAIISNLCSDIVRLGTELNAKIKETEQQRDQLLAALELLLDIRCPITGNPSHADLVEHWEYEKEEGNGEADANLQALAAIAAAKGGAI